MAYLKRSVVEAAYQRYKPAEQLRKSAGLLLQDSMQTALDETYDVFLSHSFQDAKTILGVKQLLEEEGLKVYVDWIVDSGVDRTNVTKANAELVRARMRRSLSLIYATSENADNSKWMPWELGYFDGYKPDKVGVLPLIENYDTTWTGKEYLTLYPVIEQRGAKSGGDHLFVKVKDQFVWIKNFVK